MEAEELFVVGRNDDVIVLRGRNLSPEELETALATAGLGLRAGSIAVVRTEGGYAVVAEAHSTDPALPRRIVEAATRHWSIVPAQVAIIERGSLPKTSSGKPRRRAIAGLIASGARPTLRR
jgi:acyl-coenzyme A synthetase/AMP-(fatty) acid ligase